MINENHTSLKKHLIVVLSDQHKLKRMNERGLRVNYYDWKAPYAHLQRKAKLTTLLNKRLQSNCYVDV